MQIQHIFALPQNEVSGVWRSWLAHLLWEQGVPCSSHGTPTRKARRKSRLSCRGPLITLHPQGTRGRIPLRCVRCYPLGVSFFSEPKIRKPEQCAFYGAAGHVCWATEAKLPRTPRRRPSQGALRHIGWASEFRVDSPQTRGRLWPREREAGACA